MMRNFVVAVLVMTLLAAPTALAEYDYDCAASAGTLAGVVCNIQDDGGSRLCVATIPHTLNSQPVELVCIGDTNFDSGGNSQCDAFPAIVEFGLGSGHQAIGLYACTEDGGESGETCLVVANEYIHCFDYYPGQGGVPDLGPLVGDDDNDGVPDVLELALCATFQGRDFINTATVPGTCVSDSDYEP